MNLNELKTNIFSISSEEDFRETCLQVFRYQYLINSDYSEYCDHLKRDPTQVKDIEQIPFMPISLFKERKIKSGQFRPEKIFLSSGTSGQERSKHYIKDLGLYESSFQKTFELFYGSPSDYCILALLPSYLERKDASLVYMAEKMIDASKHPESGFYLDDLSRLQKTLVQLVKNKTPILLLGVSFALLDLAKYYPVELNENSIVMETGGMKGRKKELIRSELHQILQKGFGVPQIHSEYGMTELLSQAYAKSQGRFHCPPWMKVLIREANDPFNILPPGHSGGINIIDLANLNSCSFIETMDLGKLHADNSFEVLGRFDYSDIRGCSLMSIN